MVTGDGKAPPVIVPPKQTTLYVGKIASSISDDLIRQLLDACGTVKSWKRMEDPDSKALKPFGFCEYEAADGVVRALNLLQNLSVGGQVSPRCLYSYSISQDMILHVLFSKQVPRVKPVMMRTVNFACFSSPMRTSMPILPTCSASVGRQ